MWILAGITNVILILDSEGRSFFHYPCITNTITKVPLPIRSDFVANKLFFRRELSYNIV